jgi:RNA polymerase sigma-70 factor (ECF subfamily)
MEGAARAVATIAGARAEGAELTALIARAAEADQAALSSLYDRTSARVHGLVLRIVRDEAAAEEITLDVYMQAYRQASSFDASRGHPLAWLLNLARSRAIDRVRADSRRQRRESPLEDDAPIASLAPDPDESTASSEVSRVIRAALDALSPEQRRVLEIAYYSGLSQSEVARELGLPLGTVKTRMRTGMMILRDRLRPFLGEANA